ncbi:MAG: MFS transporter [Pseudomonadota bacterium]
MAPSSRPRWLGARLSAMFFLDVAVTAAYHPLLSVHLTRALALSPAEVGLVYAMGPLATLVAPLLAGALADGKLAAERLLAIANLGRALALVLVSRATTLHEALLAVGVLGLVGSPTAVIGTSIALHHLEDAPGGIGRTRVFGTVSWIVTLWFVGTCLEALARAGMGAPTRATFWIAAGLALVSAAYALTLPRTPPSRFSGPLAFLGAVSLVKNRDFRVLLVASVLGAMCMQFHVVLHPLFYMDERAGLGLDLAATSRASSVAQMLEVALFPMLGLLVQRFGLRRVVLLGMVAWPLRFAAYVFGGPAAFVIGMQALHGVNVVCGQIAVQIAVDRLAAPAIRASSQALLAAATFGLGSLAGQLLCGVVLGVTGGVEGQGWSFVFSVPFAFGLGAALAIAFAFQRAPERVPARPGAQGSA